MAEGWSKAVAALMLGGALGAGAMAALRPPLAPPAAPGPPPERVVETVLAPQLLRLGTGAVTGAYFPVGGALCQIYNARRAAASPLCVALASGGSKDNLENLRAGTIELALVQSDWQFHAARGGPAVAPAPAMPELRALASLYKEPLTIVARREAGIAKLADLKGKRLSPGVTGSGARTLMDAVFQVQGWRAEEFRIEELDPPSAADALCAGRLDAAAFVSGHPNGLIGAAIAGCDAVLVPVTSPEIDRMLADNPFYAPASIAGGLYPGLAEPVEGFGVAVTLVARASLEPGIVAGLLEAVAAELEALQGLHPVLSSLAPEALIRDGLSAPLHDGARQVFQARGWKTAPPN